MDFTTLQYTVNGQAGLNYETALRCWKTQHKTYDVFLHEIITHDLLNMYNLYGKTSSFSQPLKRLLKETLSCED
jgi:hypothetical protein